ncbi:MAG: gamma-glutamyltransferase family protein, partial [Blastocatellia bacterium]
MKVQTLARLIVITFALSIMVSSSAQTLTYRPTVRGTRGVVAGGHPLVAEAGLRMMHKGGNAVDAGVAATLAASVIEFSHFAFGGEVPVIIKMANKPQPVTINGQGQAPQLATIEFFEKQRKDPSKPAVIPSTGPTAATVPGVLGAMIVALQNYGTMKLADVMQPAIELADGFPIDELRIQYIKNTRPAYEQWKDTTDIFLPNGQVPKIGDIFVQKNLARTLRELVEVEKKNARRGRVAAMEAVRDYFYLGPLAKRYCDAIEKAGGLMRVGDLAAFRADIDQPTKVSFHGYDVYKVGFWSQGPAMLEAMNLMESYDLKAMGHNSPDYVHTMAEAIKLAFADRERYYGDPRFVPVPIDTLLSDAYAQRRRAMLRPDRAWPEMPPCGEIPGFAARLGPEPTLHRAAVGAHDTSYVAVVDKHGNVFSATPSDTSYDTPVIPGTGLCPSSRGSQNWADPTHASSVSPGKRPRLTPSPALAVLADGSLMQFGTPGGDVQAQAMLQVFLNIALFDMNPQQAVEAPRFASYSFPDSFEPHSYSPGVLHVESRVPQAVRDGLAARGHKIVDWPEFVWRAGAVCVLRADRATDVISAGADPRRTSYAVGW